MTDTSRKIRLNIPKILTLNFFMSLYFILPIIIPYWTQFGLKASQIFILQATFGTLIILCNVPAGYLADILSRKKCMILMGLLNGIAYSIFAYASQFWHFVLFEVFVAFAACLYWGCDIGLVYDSLAAAEAPTDPQPIIAKRLALTQVAETIAAIATGWMTQISLTTPVLAQAVVGWVPFTLALTLHDPPRKKLSRHKHKENFKFIIRSIVGATPAFKAILACSIVIGSAGALAIWIYQFYWTQVGIPVTWNGYIWATSTGLVALVAKLIQKWNILAVTKWTSIFILAFPMVGFGVMTLAFGKAGVFMVGIFAIGRALHGVRCISRLNELTPPELRSTINSLVSMSVWLVIFINGAWLTYLVDQGRVELLCGLLSLVFALFAIVFGRSIFKHFHSVP